MNRRRLPNGARRDAGGLTLAERDALTHADSIWRQMGWFLTTDGNTRKATVLALVAKGLLRELDELVVVCDDDGFHKEPERYRVGYELTDAGRAHVGAHRRGGAGSDPCGRQRADRRRRTLSVDATLAELCLGHGSLQQRRRIALYVAAFRGHAVSPARFQDRGDHLLLDCARCGQIAIAPKEPERRGVQGNATDFDCLSATKPRAP